MLLFPDQVSIALRAAVAIELPNVSDFTNLIEIQVSDHKLIGIAGSLSNDLASRAAEVALSIELAYIPRLFMSDSIDRADEVAIRNCVRRLLQFPQLL